MTLFCAHGRLLYFVHIPKTGGSSLGATIRNSGARRAFHHKSTLGFLGAPVQHMHADLYTKLIPKNFCQFTVAVVRDPVARMVSEYKYQQQLRRFTMPFEDWLDMVFAEYRKDPYCYQNHIRPQHEFIAPRVKMFRFENGLEAPLQFVCDKLKLQPEPLKSFKRSANPFVPSETAIARVQDFYAKDYEVLGYGADVA